MGGGDINMPAPQQVNYGESMREALQAQVDLAHETCNSVALHPLASCLSTIRCKSR